MLKIGIMKNLFRGRKYIWSSTINNYYPKHISTNQINFKEPPCSNSKNSNESLTIKEVRAQIMKRLGLEAGYSLIPQHRDHLTKYEPKFEDLPPRTMQDSFTSATIPLGNNTDLQDIYVSVIGSVRLGRLMEDMDIFAVWICHKHLYIPNLDPNIHLPYTFVTILVDKIDFTDIVTRFDKDIRLSGHVSWVGRSSMEAVVWLEQLNENGIYKKITRALFLMAARNATNTKAAPVNPLKPGNDKELEILNDGENRKNRRINISNTSLLNVEPNNIEQKIIHEIFMRTKKDSLYLNERILPTNCRWMEDTIISNVHASFPENRNAHNKVFGGYLLKMALEISWMCAYQYCGKRPKLRHICDISFKKPVDVSSFIKLTALVIYTEMNFIQIMVIANILNFEIKDTSHTSNVFHYTFTCDDKVEEVLPKSYHEAIWYLEGKHKLAYALNLN